MAANNVAQIEGGDDTSDSLTCAYIPRVFLLCEAGLFSFQRCVSNGSRVAVGSLLRVRTCISNGGFLKVVGVVD